ncbi:MAG: type II toxin-antitoxin system VapC family toxin [Microthrixaceae bacterium]|nr:type II toxin-antitoxin system VapC family toxin [Microthrixaceae bacterium]
MTTSVGTGLLLIIDASVLFEIVADTPDADMLRQILSADTDQAAPHLVDAEVLSAVQTHHRRGELDQTSAAQAIEDLRSWPGERWPHHLLLRRAWELRNNVRGCDALYVALAEALGAPLVTLDKRLASAAGPKCEILVPTV